MSSVGGAMAGEEDGSFEAAGGTRRKTVADLPREKERGRRTGKAKKRSGKGKVIYATSFSLISL